MWRFENPLMGLNKLDPASAGHEAVDRPFHGAHVHATGETDVGAEEIAVTVFLAVQPRSHRAHGAEPVPSPSLTTVERDRIEGSASSVITSPTGTTSRSSETASAAVRNRPTSSRQFAGSRSGR